jgi:C1A family cysteine protease
MISFLNVFAAISTLTAPFSGIAPVPTCEIRNMNNVFILDHNGRDLSYEVEHNQFSEVHYINGENPSLNHYIRPEHKTPYLVQDDAELPKHVDWRDTHDVSSIKNQLNCGSCWAFSATGATESAWSIHHRKLYNLSQQELVDCSGSYGNQGCDGGMMDNAFQYIIDNGLCTNSSYPYQANSGQCMNTTCHKVVHIKKYHDIKPNEHALARAVVKQPVSVAIQANLQSFQLYKSGIYSDPNCGDDLDHGVLVVGYGYDSSWDMKYWIVKNSWGSTWGDNGYIRIQKDINDSSGLCGIAIDPSIPII